MGTLQDKWIGRHPSTVQLLRWLDPNPNLPDDQRAISQVFAGAAETLLQRISVDGPELTTALRKMIEAKDCAVRASMY